MSSEDSRNRNAPTGTLDNWKNVSRKIFGYVARNFSMK